MSENKLSLKDQIKQYAKQCKTIPNILSFIRIALIPVFAVFMVKARQGDTIDVKNLIIALVIFVAAGLTDLFDGKIARRFNQVTDLGKILDPVADKLTQFAVTIVLFIWFWGDWLFIGLFSVYILKEILQLVAGFIMLRRWDHAVAARIWGKVATVVFYITIVILFLTSEKGIFATGMLGFTFVMPKVILYIIVGISVVFMFLAFYSYIPDYVKAMNRTSQRGLEEIIMAIILTLVGVFLVLVAANQVFYYIAFAMFGSAVTLVIIGAYRLKKTKGLPNPVVSEETEGNGE